MLHKIATIVRKGYNQITPPETFAEIIHSENRKPGVLTNRERDVLILSSHGLTNQEIAEKLTMSTSAVRTFLNRAFNKLGARKKADAVQLALKHKEISVSEISAQDELAYYLAPLGAESIEKLAGILEQKCGKKPGEQVDQPHDQKPPSST